MSRTPAFRSFCGNGQIAIRAYRRTLGAGVAQNQHAICAHRERDIDSSVHFVIALEDMARPECLHRAVRRLQA